MLILIIIFVDLAEHLKLLGFPNQFPLQALYSSFGSLASFHVVAEILQWLAGLMEPGATLAGGTATEDERVILIRSATEFFVTKSAIKLNPRKLYAGSAVTAGELQKITKLLIAPASNLEDNRDAEDEKEQQIYRSLNQFDIGDKMNDLRRARELCSDLTQRGAALHDLLAKEMINREARLAQANRPMELAVVERTLKNAVSSLQVRLQSNKAQLESARVELNALNSKLQRKRAELERTKQRLEALQKIRPAHQQEFEDCEKELKLLFQQYFQRLHVRDALRAQLEARTKRVYEQQDEPIVQRKTSENSMPFIPEDLLADDDEPEDEESEAQLGGKTNLKSRQKYGLDETKRDSVNAEASKRPGTATSRIRPTTGRGRKPALSSKDIPDDDSSFGSSDSDLDMEGLLGISAGANGMGLNGSSAGMLGSEDCKYSEKYCENYILLDKSLSVDMNSMDDMSISITGDLPLRPKTASKQEHSDEDF